MRPLQEPLGEPPWGARPASRRSATRRGPEGLAYQSVPGSVGRLPSSCSPSRSPLSGWRRTCGARAIQVCSGAQITSYALLCSVPRLSNPRTPRLLSSKAESPSSAGRPSKRVDSVMWPQKGLQLVLATHRRQELKLLGLSVHAQGL